MIEHSALFNNQLKLRSRIVFIVALVLGLQLLCFPQEQPPKGIKFEVVSVRVLDEEESLKRTPDVIGADIVVRLRLSCVERGISFYGDEFTNTPQTYIIKKVGNEIMWYCEGNPKTSPGLSFFGSKGRWIIAPRYSVLEWEVIDLVCYQGSHHAISMFVKDSRTMKMMEIISDFYTVPGGQEGSARQK